MKYLLSQEVFPTFVCFFLLPLLVASSIALVGYVHAETKQPRSTYENHR